MEGAGVEDGKNVCMNDLQGLCGNVDGECSRKEKVQVLQEGEEVYSAVLTQTDLGANKNKFYIVQLHKDITGKEYYVWHHWGRIGYKGRHMEKKCGLLEAKKIFLQKFKDKTGNEWEKREQFQKKRDLYDLMKMETKFEFPQMEKELKSIAMQTSKLDKKVQELVNLLYNTEVIEKTMESMGYNQKQSPLGKMTLQQVMDGYAALKEVELCIENEASKEELTVACTKYYTKIPHKFGGVCGRREEDSEFMITLVFGFSVDIFFIVAALAALYDIQMTGLKSKEHDSMYYTFFFAIMKRPPLITTQEQIEAELELLEMVQKYLNGTHESDHNEYTMEMLDVFKVSKKELPFEDVGNRRLLWHGSRLSNWAGILTQGLRVAPPEAPSTGYMFGKGVYFADRSSKSCNYCRTNKEENVGLALLCEVALGESHELVAANKNAHQLPPGKKSVKGLGQIAPDSKENLTMSCGTVVPLGKGIPTGVQNKNGITLRFNEYVVYDTKQIKLRYLVKVKFNWK
ncbi:Poly [ADP-ribose] polymerase 2 [Holothuria leucospilota]|uniref:Poly [ADP-ribose] polymerase n=1 Tax=Holothuria leucospilota TaxID=206669 RepID=A0A9Q0YJQ4_HOLLE|nr:Poly [ADP-ribose] polymerase 2 [Holothuria leucospilota]